MGLHLHSHNQIIGGFRCLILLHFYIFLWIVINKIIWSVVVVEVGSWKLEHNRGVNENLLTILGNQTKRNHNKPPTTRQAPKGLLTYSWLKKRRLFLSLSLSLSLSEGFSFWAVLWWWCAWPGLLSAFSPNYATLLALHCAVGFGLGGGPVFSCCFLELGGVAVSSLTEASGIGCCSSLLSGRLAPLLEARLPWMVNFMILTPHDYNDYNNSNLLQLVLLDLDLDLNLNWRCLLAFSSPPLFGFASFLPSSLHSHRPLVIQSSHVYHRHLHCRLYPCSWGTLINSNNNNSKLTHLHYHFWHILNLYLEFIKSYSVYAFTLQLSYSPTNTNEYPFHVWHCSNSLCILYLSIAVPNVSAGQWDGISKRNGKNRGIGMPSRGSRTCGCFPLNGCHSSVWVCLAFNRTFRSFLSIRNQGPGFERYPLRLATITTITPTIPPLFLSCLFPFFLQVYYNPFLIQRIHLKNK